MKYDVNYFINKFSAIPEERWTVRNYILGNKRCALGHCGMGIIFTSREALALIALFKSKLDVRVSWVNDGKYASLGRTPKERILNALELIAAGVSV